MIPMSPRAPALIVWSLILLAIAATAVVLRVVSTHIRRRPFKVHDYLVFLSLFALVGYVADVLMGAIIGGFGGHTVSMAKEHPEQVTIALKTFFASEWFWATATACFRLAILLLYIEIFPGHDTFFWCATAVAGLVFLYWVASILTIALLCRPVEYNWNRAIPGVCGDVVKTEYASAGFNMVIDLGVVLLPLPIVWRLHMSSRKKTGVTASFALGIITAGINLGRIISTKLCPTNDIIYCARDSSIFVIAEMTAGILVACVPTLGPLFFRRAKVPSARPHGLPTIGSARVRPTRRALKLDSLSTFDHTQDDEGRTGWKELGGPVGSAHAVGPGTRPPTVDAARIMVTRDLDVQSLNPPPATPERF
ncbi:hypothetical protein NUU61_001133 [Penicillium alfredii]|uniref:Rhodopsin domain-containing protein n=1 Tax=Penicillium alfredii TaxID=1506179 RepID=A0A9W9GAX1_9EURO|nr:uncharacterized protein NUU61_001133 [Penicillium alfredii]KAJ5115374.1 hypothetical protein NUU61_001133 [Penicillium alfredii]